MAIQLQAAHAQEYGIYPDTLRLYFNAASGDKCLITGLPLLCERADPVWGLKDGVLHQFPANTPALVTDPGGFQALMASPPSTNLVEYSQDFTDEWWHDTRCGFAGPVEGPAGNVDALGLVGDTEASSHYIYSEQISASPGDMFNLSCFAIPGARTWLELRLAYYDAGAVFLDGESFYVQVPSSGPYNGWTRIQAPLIVPTGAATVRVILRPNASEGVTNYAGDGATVDMWLTGVQLEEGFGATPYIPTAGAAASRGSELRYFPASPGVLAALQAGAAGTLAAQVAFGFDQVNGPDQQGLVACQPFAASMLYYSPSSPIGALLSSDTGYYGTAIMAMAWTRDTFYPVAVRWGGGQFQVGVEELWGGLTSDYLGYTVGDPARIYLAYPYGDGHPGPVYMRSLRIYDQWLEADNPAQIGG